MVKFSDLEVGKDWARTGVTSFGRQYDFHYVIYNILTRNVDNRRRNDF